MVFQVLGVGADGALPIDPIAISDVSGPLDHGVRTDLSILADDDPVADDAVRPDPDSRSQFGLRRD